MKRAILSTTLILGMSLCSQSFGFDLLDRMLGLNCGGGSSSCCDTPCCDSGCCEPTCGCESSCCESCCEPACGCEASCCESSCCEPCQKKSSGGLLAKLFGGFSCKKDNCCDSCCDSCGTCCEPACGCEMGCSSCGSMPAAPACSSCNGGAAPAAPAPAPAVEDAAPMPPAPVVDPSAYLNSKRRVIQASTHFAR